MAKSIRRTILDEPGYWEYCARYHNDFTRFVCENSSQKPSWQQFLIMDSVSKPDCKVAIASGHGTGKGWLMGWYCTWHLTVVDPRLAFDVLHGVLNPDIFSQMLLTANNAAQCRIGVWKYIDTAMAQVGNHFPFIKGHFNKDTEKFYCTDVFGMMKLRDVWFVEAKTAPKHKPEGVAGRHAKQYTLLIDEASGVEDVLHDVMEGALTQDGNRHIMISQPTRSSGRFADAFGILKSQYETFNLNSEESPHVTKKWINEHLVKYGGHHSPEYQIKVLGRLPDNLSGYLIPKTWLEESQRTKIEHKGPWGWLVTVDVAEGVHRDSSVYALWSVSGYGEERLADCKEQVEYLEHNERDFARIMYAELKQKGLQNLTIAVDGDGPGRTVILLLEEMIAQDGLGWMVQHIHWGLPCHMQADQKRYANQRAFSSVKTREAIFHDRRRLPPGKKVVEQGSKIPYKIDERGRYVIMPKEQMKGEGIKSPDLFDTVCFVELADFVPVCEEVDETRNEMMDMAKRILAGEA